MPALMDAREQALRAFAEQQLSVDSAADDWRPITGDASSRRYFRLSLGARSWICADSPPATEKNAEFLQIRSTLEQASLPVPALLAADLETGFLVLEDFGDRHLQQSLDTRRPSADYGGALDLLLKLQTVNFADLPEYSEALLREEYSRFYQWFCLGWLQLPEREADRELVSEFGELLIADALQQPRVFVFRDYHCRNLMLRDDNSIGLIDFQDAVAGPLCYDLASLLRDCYIRWPEEQIRQWALVYRQHLLAAGRDAGASDAEFMRWLDWVGLHRHLKVLGNFTRLALRDKKDGYLADIPLVLEHISAVLHRYTEFAEFNRWFRETLGPLIEEQRWESRS